MGSIHNTGLQGGAHITQHHHDSSNQLTTADRRHSFALSTISQTYE